MFSQPLVLLFIFLVDVQKSRASPTVTVGFNSTTPQSFFVFTENDASPKLPVFLSDPARTDNKLPLNGVTISCSLSTGQPTGLPFTTATIAHPALTADATGLVQRVDMTITFTTSGRPVQFYCNATGTAVFPGVVSNVFSLQRKKAPLVSICSPVTQVPQQTPKTAFQIKLSDVVVNSNVTVNCTQSQPVPAANLNANIDQVDILVGNGGINRETAVPFEVTRKGADSTVTCTANSGDSKQYKTSNSNGSSTRMTMEPLGVTFVPQRLTTSTERSSLLLTLAAPVARSSPETFLCKVVLVADNAAESAAVASPACNSSITSAGSNSTNTTNVVWTASDRIEIAKGKTSQILFVNRSSIATTAMTERLVLTCCANPSDTTSLYFGKVATAYVTAVFPGIMPTNTTIAQASTAETVLPNPAFVNPAACPCDLTADSCDLGCCCDSLCNRTASQLLKPCLTGYFGGDTASLPSKPHRCDLPVNQQTEDYHTLMCIMYENNAVLGEYYTPTKTKMTADAVQTLVQQSASNPQFTNNGVRTPVNTATSYKVGGDVFIESKEGNTNQRRSLTLPGAGFKGSCNRDRTVRFIEDREATCDVTVTATCPRELSARSYLVGGNLTHPACPTYPAVLASIGNNFHVPTTVEYYCVENGSSLSGTYTRSSAGSPSSTSSSFPALTSLVNCTFTGSNIVCSRSQRLSSSSASLSIKRCSFDDGYSLPPEVTAATTTLSRVCNNAVLNVSYAFAWNQTSLTALRAYVLMGTVGVGETLSQSFKVNFTFGNSAAAAPQTNPLRKRSGFFGYDNGKPVIGGRRVVNNTQQTIDASTANWPFVLKPTASGLCGEAGTEPLLFPYNSHSSCRIYLKLSDFEDCTTLRTNLFTYVNLLTPFDVVASYGSPDINTATDWASVVSRYFPSLGIPGTIPNSVLSNFTNSNFTNATNSSTATSATSGGINITISQTQAPFGNFIKGKCLSVPYGVRMSIIYAEQGKARSEPIYQIIGVEKLYLTAHMELPCDSSQNSPCRDTNLGQQFFLDVNYVFKQIPASWKTSIYNLYKHGTQCWWDICIEDMFSLWTSSFFLAIRLEIIGYSLLILLIGIPVLLFAWPW